MNSTPTVREAAVLQQFLNGTQERCLVVISMIAHQFFERLREGSFPVFSTGSGLIGSSGVKSPCVILTRLLQWHEIHLLLMANGHEIL